MEDVGRQPDGQAASGLVVDLQDGVLQQVAGDDRVSAGDFQTHPVGSLRRMDRVAGHGGAVAAHVHRQLAMASGFHRDDVAADHVPPRIGPGPKADVEPAAVQHMDHVVRHDDGIPAIGADGDVRLPGDLDVIAANLAGAGENLDGIGSRIAEDVVDDAHVRPLEHDVQPLSVLDDAVPHRDVVGVVGNLRTARARGERP